LGALPYHILPKHDLANAFAIYQFICNPPQRTITLNHHRATDNVLIMPSNTTFTAQVGVAARAKPARRKSDPLLPDLLQLGPEADNFAKGTRNQALPSGEWCITADGLVDWVDSTEPAEVSVPSLSIVAQPKA